MNKISVYKFILLIIICSYSTISVGQSPSATLNLSKAGLTFKKDTSFTNNSAFIKTIKTHPNTKRVFVDPQNQKIMVLKNQDYSNVNNTALYLDAYLPQQDIAVQKRLSPAIIIIHGGGWRSGSRDQHEALAVTLANKGYACFTVDYNLSTHALYPMAYLDILKAISYLKKNAKKYNINTQQLTLLGYSAGGALASLVASKTNDVQALINVDGVLAFIHPESGEGDDSKSISAATHWFGIGKNEGATIWNDASALTYLSNYRTPTLFINSGVKRMQAGQKEFINHLKSQQIFMMKKDFPDAPHTFILFDPWFSEIAETCLSFLNQIFPKNS